MLKELMVEGLGVIERAETDLGKGSIALTGETGAGKTLVVAALGLLLGGRADRSLIRAGCVEARVEGLFELPADHPVVRTLDDLGLMETGETGPIEIIVSRSVSSGSASSKARVNGRIVTAGLLAELSGSLVEIAGQHEHQRLGSPAYQRELLDSFAGPQTVALCRELRDRFRDSVDLARRFEEFESGQRNRLRELDAMKAEIAQIEKVDPRPGEQAQLRLDADRLEFAAAIAAGVETSLEKLRGDAGVEETLGNVEEIVTGLTGYDPVMEGLAKRLETARYEIADIGDELRSRSVTTEPSALDEIRARLDELAKLQHRYGDTEEEVLAHLESCRTRVEEIESASSGSGSLKEQALGARAEAEDLAIRLSAARADAAKRMQEEVGRRMEDLALADASFSIGLEPHELSATGSESVTFLLGANPGEPVLPLAKVASGGELSRVALALHLAVAGRSASVPTMVFDEVDAGVGGAAARAVGRALADLARSTGSQVIVVTHLPQVAAFADLHLRVSKATDTGTTRSLVSTVEGDERVVELSRMLAGLPGSEMAQEHAKELLDLASAELPVS